MYREGQIVQIMTEEEALSKFQVIKRNFDNSYSLILDDGTQCYIASTDNMNLFGREFIIKSVFNEDSTNMEYFITDGYQFSIPTKLIKEGKKNNIDW